MKVIIQHFVVVHFTILFKVVLTLDTVDETLKSDNSIESHREVSLLFFGAVRSNEILKKFNFEQTVTYVKPSSMLIFPLSIDQLYES